MFKSFINLLLRLTKRLWEFLFSHNVLGLHNTKELIIVRIDKVGDYLLWRNFIKEIKLSEKYADYKITLCGNIIWKEFSELLDSEYIDRFIWIDTYLFWHSPWIVYRFRTLLKINKIKYDVLLNPTFSRDVNVDEFVHLINADIKVGCLGDDINQSIKDKIKSDKYYTELINIDKQTRFEFDRNCRFFGLFLSKDFASFNIFIDFEAKQSDFKYVVIFPGSGLKIRQWPVENYINLIKKLLELNNYFVYLAGQGNEKKLYNEIIQKTSPEVMNIAGCSVSELLTKLKFASLVICNDSAGFHMSMCFNRPTLCISNGNQYGRFIPYPDSYDKTAAYVFPPVFYHPGTDNNSLAEKYARGSREDISLINVETVWSEIQKLINVH